LCNQPSGVCECAMLKICVSHGFWESNHVADSPWWQPNAGKPNTLHTHDSES